MPADPEYHHTLRVADVPPAGKNILIKVAEQDRARIAKAFDLASLKRFEANLRVTPKANGDMDVIGTLEADLEYRCVVTLEPFAGNVREELHAVFSDKLPTEFPEELEVTEDMPDLPEQVINGTIDVGALVAEYLALGLELYPRKPDAVLDPALGRPDPEDHPFAALARLKKGE